MLFQDVVIIVPVSIFFKIPSKRLKDRPFSLVNLPLKNCVEMTLWTRAFIKNMAELQITSANNFAYDFAISQVT